MRQPLELALALLQNNNRDFLKSTVDESNLLCISPARFWQTALS
jgi:hypothetical protein